MVKTVLYTLLLLSSVCYGSTMNSIPSITPVNGYLSSGFGWRISPFRHKKSYHEGVDIAAPLGAPVLAPADGIVKVVGRVKGLGRYVIIAHSKGIETKYGHLRNIRVKKGQRVKKGARIAAVGMTGRTTGAHLHYEVIINGKLINPQKFILDQ